MDNKYVNAVFTPFLGLFVVVKNIFSKKVQKHLAVLMCCVYLCPA